MLNNLLRTACIMVGIVESVTDAQQFVLATKVLVKDPANPDGAKIVHTDRHPVLCPKDTLPQIKEGKRLLFFGIVRRHGKRTKLQLDPKRFSHKAKAFAAIESGEHAKDFTEVEGIKYLNKATVAGQIIWSNPLNSAIAKITVGIAKPGTVDEAIYCVGWRDFAATLITALRTNTVEVLMDGFMRCREMTGARKGDIMYELNASDRGASKILNRDPIKTLLDAGAPDMEAALAFEFDPPVDEPKTAAPAADAVPKGDGSDIPF
jgi:hypothetical protein